MTAQTLAPYGDAAAATEAGPPGSNRKWALRWAYFFLCIFAAFALLPPLYMLITALKTSTEISAATNPWWVYNPTLANFAELLTSPLFLTFFKNSVIVSILTVLITMLIHPPKSPINPMLYLGFLFASIGAAMVLYFRPTS